MNKSEIYVEITNEKERLRAIEILEKSGESVSPNQIAMIFYGSNKNIIFDEVESLWYISTRKRPHQITLEQLEEMLMPKNENPLFIAQRYIIDNFPPGTVVTITNGLIEVK
jgi:hypothetical protein